MDDVRVRVRHIDGAEPGGGARRSGAVVRGGGRCRSRVRQDDDSEHGH